MKIVHICLCDPYAENWSYHRNILSEQNAGDGHDTYIITTEYAMNINGKRGTKETPEYRNQFGVNVIRLEDKYKLPKSINSKINTVKGIKEKLNSIQPDIIMVHNQQTLNMLDIVDYKKKNPNVILLADSHASFANSCRNFLSRWIVQGIVFRKVIQRSFKYIDGMYYIGEEELRFFRTVYGIKQDKNSILPLPARFISEAEKEKNRIEVRAELKMLDEELLFIHSGKLSAEKRTADILLTLKKFGNQKFKLLIIGSIPDEQKNLENLIKRDPRFIYLGWKTSRELMRYISASDLYIMPGSVSVTMNNSLAVGTPVMLYPHRGYNRYFSGWEILVSNIEEMNEQFRNIFANPRMLRAKKRSAFEAAYKYFDCKNFAQEMYNYVEKEDGPLTREYINGLRYISNESSLH